MDHDYLLELKRSHPALRLLAADTAPLILSFLYRVFVQPNRRGIGQEELESMLDDYLFGLRRIHGETIYPQTASRYLEAWADPARAILRKYYPERGDEPEYDLTPATARAIDWVQGLKERKFVGTESRLRIIISLLKDIIQATEEDPETVIRELEKRRREIDDRIATIRKQGVLPPDATRVREQFFQAEDTARMLLADFRQVEENFRILDRQTRELIATSDRPKGSLLDEIFRDSDVIRDSDQGKSFQAFWELLMAPERQAELQRMLEQIYRLEEIRELHPDPFLEKLRYQLLESGEQVYKTANRLVEQLRRFLDDQAWLENRRIMELIREIEKQAIEIKDRLPQNRGFAEVDQVRPSIELPMERPLFSPTRSVRLDPAEVEEGVADEIDADLLFEQVYVDRKKLRRRIDRLLAGQGQVSLPEILEAHPPEQGLAELVAYVDIGCNLGVVDDERRDRVRIKGTHGRRRIVHIPRIVFVRK